MKISVYFLILIFSVNNCFSDDLGIVGQIDWIKSRATTMVKNGEWQKLQTQAIKNTREKINNPAPVLGITDAQITRTWFFTPMVQLKENLTDTQGHVIAKAGNYNALRYKPFDTKLIFINGNNLKQVDWALSKNAESEVRVKIVLTQGSFIDLDKKHKLWFYYDQNGKYTQKLNITHVPAIVEQSEDRLKITEIANKEL